MKYFHWFKNSTNENIFSTYQTILQYYDEIIVCLLPLIVISHINHFYFITGKGFIFDRLIIPDIIDFDEKYKHIHILYMYVKNYPRKSTSYHRKQNDDMTQVECHDLFERIQDE